jgi:hypothetical protein
MFFFQPLTFSLQPKYLSLKKLKPQNSIGLRAMVFIDDLTFQVSVISCYSNPENVIT